MSERASWVPVTEANPEVCTPDHACGSHEEEHEHGPACGHVEVQHGDHVDYLVDDHLHHPHGDHCDDHGRNPAAGEPAPARPV